MLKALGLATESGLSDLLRQLREKDFITIAGGVRGRQRLIELTTQGRARTGFGVPILGEIPAGPLAEAIQDCDEWLDGFGPLLKARPGDFGLRVKGYSMIGDGIMPGDKVLLRPGIAWRPGEIVAAQIHGEDESSYEGTLKHIDLLNNGKTVRLRASNSEYNDMEFDARQVSIAGVFRGLVRTVD